MSSIATAREIARDIRVWTEQITEAGNLALIDNNLRDARALADAINNGHVADVTDDGMMRLLSLSGALRSLREPRATRTMYAFNIEASNDEGTVWQVMAGEVQSSNLWPDEFAEAVAANQSYATGNNWRVRVWSSAEVRDSGVYALATAGPRG